MTPVQTVWRPADAAEVQVAVRDAIASRRSLELIGTGSRRDLGPAARADAVLDLSLLSGIVDYQTEELVITLRPGTPMAEVEALLAQNRQMLAFEPPDLGPLWGRPPGGGTIGGALMVGRGGPRRLMAGGPRDHCLGVSAVNGFGEAWSSGGRVVKNVTGFDLPKLVAASFGILGPVAELTFKTTPRPERTLSVIVLDRNPAQATAVMAHAMSTSAQVSSAAYLPARIAAASSVPALAGFGTSATLLRLEGMQGSVASRAEALSQALTGRSPDVLLDDDASRIVWREIANAAAFVDGGDSVVWHLSVPPSAGAGLGSGLAGMLEGRWFCDWAGGGVWLCLPPAPDAHAGIVRRTMRSLVGADGQATLVRAAPDVRAVVSPIEPLSPAVAALNRRVKSQFDPHGLFNPGRLYGDL